MNSGENLKLPLIETERLILTVFQPQDAHFVASYVNENKDHLAPWSENRSEEYYTPAFWEGQLASWLEEFREGRALRLAILDRTDIQGPLVGLCNFTNIIRGPFQACFLGYHLDFRAEGKGLMYEAASHAIDYVFKQLKLHRIMANYMPANVRSARLLRRLNFVTEGVARDYLFLAGSWQDHILTSLINLDA